MRVLWLCNVTLPVIAKQLNMEGSNKEGWISGMADSVLKKQGNNAIELAVAFPVSAENLAENQEFFIKDIKVENAALTCCGFLEDVTRAEIYDTALEERLGKIVEAVQPDIVHCFGTEYAHTLAMCRTFPQKNRLLVGLQGLCSLIAEAYFASLPEEVIHSKTLRDCLRRDSLIEQQQKFVLRGEMERATIGLAGNITGRTEWDKANSREWNPGANYYSMNETLRPDFYEQTWEPDKCIPHSIFLSQGDYPLKGLHYMLLALPEILEKYQDATVYVAGDSLVNYKTLKQKLKISAYGKYLRKLLKENHLEERVTFLGRLNSEQMRERYLKSSLFVCCSSLENSPNSLGEAMLLGMPCVSAAVGGIPTMFTHGEDGIMYEGFSEEKNELEEISKRLADAVIEMWGDPEKMEEYCKNAKNHAKKTHNKEENYEKMLEIYAKMMAESEE